MEAQNEVERETLVDREYRGVNYEIVRTNEDTHTSGFEYEFLLYVEGEKVTTASELETRGYTNPWIGALETYVNAYIDGRLD